MLFIQEEGKETHSCWQLIAGAIAAFTVQTFLANVTQARFVVWTNRKQKRQASAWASHRKISAISYMAVQHSTCLWTHVYSTISLCAVCHSNLSHSSISTSIPLRLIEQFSDPPQLQRNFSVTRLYSQALTWGFKSIPHPGHRKGWQAVASSIKAFTEMKQLWWWRLGLQVQVTVAIVH